jgi:UDP-glucuronate decarboxylase
MKVLVTGGAGFIGLHLAEAMARRGHAVTLVDRSMPDTSDTAVGSFLASGPHAFAQIDLCHPGALAHLGDDFDGVCHLAALLGVEAVRKDPLAVLTDNIRTNAEALRFASRQRNLSRFMFASTSEVYAGTLQHFSLEFPTPETTVLAIPDLSEPRTSYMLSKIYGEALTRQSGLPFTIVRPHNVYGPRMGMRHVVPQMMKRLLETPPGGAFPVYSPAHTRTFCFAEDAARLMAAALESTSCAGETLNVGAGGPEVTMMELAEKLAVLLDRTVRLVPAETTPGSPSRRRPDISRITGLTGQRPVVDLDTGLRLTYEWYDRHVFAGTSS